MRSTFRRSGLAAAFLLPSVLAAIAQTSPGTSLAAQFDSHLSAADQSAWMKLMASEPNQVGSPHDKANAEWLLARYKEWGWDAHIETFQVLYPTPVAEMLEMAATDDAPAFTATLQEPPIPGDTSATAKDYALPAYVAYQGDGDVTAPLIYVNYGMPDDYKRLAEMGVDVKGKIVIVRYGKGWRGLKPKLAQEHGAVGCLIYSDPADDGYAVNGVYPNGPMRPPGGIQRGSVTDMTLFPGDPLTPGIAATKNAKRLTRETSPAILKIPTLPISYADATVFLKTLTGQPVPSAWRGGLPITYRAGPGNRAVHLMVQSEWSLKPAYDVIAMLKGAQYPDQWVIRGNHFDGWVFGASDPLSGQVAQMDEARALGALVKSGWRPKRTIVYASWDAEEPALLGSTEWVEAHAAELQKKAVLYLNSDGNSRGFLGVGGSEDLRHFASQVADAIPDPQTKVSVGARARAAIRVEAAGPGAREAIKAQAKDAADPAKDLPIDPLGSGSDYSGFLQHLGIATLDIGYGGEGTSGGVYHSRYDTWEHHTRFVDPGLVYGKVLAQTAGRLVIGAADADLPLNTPDTFAAAVGEYLKEVKKLADDRRKAATERAVLLKAGVFALAADPTKSHADPEELKTVPDFDFAPLDTALVRLQASAAAYDTAVAAHGAALDAGKRRQLLALLQSIGQTLLVDQGLPFRDWYKNVITAPGRFTGYGAKTLPGVREAIEEDRFDDAVRYIGITAGALNAYSARLDQAVALLNG
ncbi:MAG: M28 family peptidase [Alphaproteobacteria bacterium]|nr:M28 family peptidase [Alphaproteobacteria bacterium]